MAQEDCCSNIAFELIDRRTVQFSVSETALSSIGRFFETLFEVVHGVLASRFAFHKIRFLKIRRMQDGYCFVSAGQSKRTASPFANPLFLCDDSEGVASNKVHTIPFARAKQRIDVLFLAMVNSFNAIFFRDVPPFRLRRPSPAVCGKNIVWRTTRQAIRNRESIALNSSVLQKLVKELARLAP